MKRYKGIIFDLDGVICSTDNLHYQAWLKISKSLGLKFDEEINNQLRGIGRSESLRIILNINNKNMEDDEIEKIATEKNEIYVNLLDSMSESNVSEDVSNTLKELKLRNIKIAIGSSSRNAKLILHKLGLYDMFDAISDGNNITDTKPDPEVFLLAAQYIELNPNDCLVVEDADVGIEAAIRGGFDSAGISVASENPNATYRIHKLTEILDKV